MQPLISSLQPSSEVGTIIINSLLLRKLRLREVEYVAQGQPAKGPPVKKHGASSPPWSLSYFKTRIMRPQRVSSKSLSYHQDSKPQLWGRSQKHHVSAQRKAIESESTGAEAGPGVGGELYLGNLEC